MTKGPKLKIPAASFRNNKEFALYQTPPRKIYGMDQSADTGSVETFEVILTRKADYGTSRYRERTRRLKAK